MARSKTVYRDKLTNRLIPEKAAKRLDPSTWYEEQWVDPNSRSEVDSADDLVSETRPREDEHGEVGAASESIHDHQDRHAAIVDSCGADGFLAESAGRDHHIQL